MLAERRLQRDLESLRESLSKLMVDFESLAKEKGQAVVETVKDETASEREKLQQLMQAAGESLKTLQERAKEATHDVEGTIKEHPLAAVAAAVGIGYLLGKLLSPGKR